MFINPFYSETDLPPIILSEIRSLLNIDANEPDHTLIRCLLQVRFKAPEGQEDNPGKRFVINNSTELDFVKPIILRNFFDDSSITAEQLIADFQNHASVCTNLEELQFAYEQYMHSIDAEESVVTEHIFSKLNEAEQMIRCKSCMGAVMPDSVQLQKGDEATTQLMICIVCGEKN